MYGGAVMSAKPVKKAGVKSKIKSKLKPVVKANKKAKINAKVKVNTKAKAKAKVNAKAKVKLSINSKTKAIKKPVVKKPAPPKKGVTKTAAKTPKKPLMTAKKEIKTLPKKVAKPPVIAKVVAKKEPVKAKLEIQTINKKATEPMTETLLTKPAPIIKPKPTKVTANKSHLSTMGVPPYQESKDEEYMNLNQREHFAKILRLWKKELMEEVDRTVHHMQDDAANFPDPNDRATQEEEFSLELRARDRERKLIKKIEESLQKIENNEYGYCDVCGVEIGIRRLEARPTATLCIDCKTLDEIRERTHG